MAVAARLGLRPALAPARRARQPHHRRRRPERDSDVVDTACTAPVALATAGTLTNLDLGLAAATVDRSVSLSGAWSAASSGEIARPVDRRAQRWDRRRPGPVVVGAASCRPDGEVGVPAITAPGMACTFDADSRALV
ncbi:MAG: hypothetical protein R2710_11020 [Acidimicrobiales bacterium]